MLSNVDCPQRKVQILTLKKTGLGTPAISGSTANFCTITDNNTGDYTINFTKSPFALAPEVFLQMVTAETVGRVSVLSNTSARILTFAEDGTTPAEADFHFMAVGTLVTDLQG